MFVPLLDGDDVYQLSKSDQRALQFDAHTDAMQSLTRADIRRIMQVRWWNPFSWFSRPQTLVTRVRAYSKVANFAVAYSGGLATIESAFADHRKRNKL